MLAALSIADHGLFERILEATFPQHLPDSGTSTPGANGRADPRSNALIIGHAIKKKTADAVLACKEMLLREPPERMTEFWGTVSLSTAKPTPPASSPTAQLRARYAYDSTSTKQALTIRCRATRTT